MNLRTITIAATLLFILCCPVFGQFKKAEKIYKKINDGVVRIYTYHQNNTLHGQASGVIIKKKNWIVTNYHILGDAEVIYAEHEGKSVKLDSVIAMDPDKDILVLQMSKPDDANQYKSIPNIRIGNSNDLKVGQKIYAIGSPYGFENTITEGIISGFRTSFDSKQNFIQISAPISSGSSGGAVVNIKGELIGISTLIIKGETAQNLNFAIFINDVLEAANKSAKKPTTDSKVSLVNYYYQRGYNEYLSKNYLSAIFNYKMALKSKDERGSATLFCNIGIAYHKLDFLDSAITWYNKSLTVAEGADAYVGLGSVYYEQNDFDKAIYYYKKAIETVSDFYEAYIGLGLVYYTKGDYLDALFYLKKVIELNVKSPKAYMLIGHISYTSSQFDDAISFYKRAIKAKPDYAEAYLSLANAYIKIGSMEKAIEFQQKAYQLKPELRNSKN
ncbi:MAG: tetratricopeptide repeat protein [Cytophagales bacterium]|nr:tetratricopeptide repeat protein [Cytophagales bacterium]